MNNRLHTPENAGLKAIRHEWAWCTGAVTAAVLLSLWVSPLWMPAVEILLAVILVSVNPGRVPEHSKPCGRLTRVSVFTLITTGILSLLINIAYYTKTAHNVFGHDSVNESIPYITSLIIFPVLTATAFWASTRRASYRHIRSCYLHNEYSSGRPLFGRVVHSVYRSMLRVLTLLGLAVSVIDWAYYFISYHNSSITKPDQFFFFIVPVAAYVWSVIYVHNRYSAIILANGIKLSGTAVDGRSVTDSSIMRFLVIHQGRLLLDVTPHTVAAALVDTPAVAVKSPAYKGDVQSARTEFEHIAGIADFSLRVLYESNNPAHNNRIYHFVAIVPDQASTGRLKGQWTTLDEIDRMLKAGIIAPKLSAEIYRIYTITMAWKTYDRKGRRLYPIRNYRPTFRLADFHKWTVDYNDTHWLRVARINQDTPAWRLRRLFL